MFRDVGYCTDKLIQFWKLLQPAFKAKYPGWGIYISCAFRSPAEQFELFKKGRIVQTDVLYFDKDGVSVAKDAPTRDTSKDKLHIVSANVIQPAQIVTKVDGITRIGSHSTNPSTAFDVAISTPEGQNNWNTDLPQWKELGGFLTLTPGIIWGGNWGKRDENGKLLPGQFVDHPHFEDTDYTLKFNNGIVR